MMDSFIYNHKYEVSNHHTLQIILEAQQINLTIG